jgi:hypothetical protein
MEQASQLLGPSDPQGKWAFGRPRPSQAMLRGPFPLRSPAKGTRPGSSAEGKGEEGIDGSFERTSAPLHLGQEKSSLERGEQSDGEIVGVDVRWKPPVGMKSSDPKRASGGQCAGNAHAVPLLRRCRHGVLRPPTRRGQSESTATPPSGGHDHGRPRARWCSAAASLLATLRSDRQQTVDLHNGGRLAVFTVRYGLYREL